VEPGRRAQVDTLVLLTRSNVNGFE